MRALAAVQECSGLVVLVVRRPGARRVWLRPPEAGLSREEAERIIERDGVKVSGR